MISSRPSLALSLVLALSPALSAEPTTEPSTRPSAQAGLDQELQQTLTNAVLVGHFTIDGQDAFPKQDRYTILKATKVQGDLWLLTARIQYGGRDVTVPLPIPVRWAGDTAVLSVTDLTVPGVGAYTARVVLYRDRYAGTWSASDHAGALWGKIERAK